MKRCMSVGPIPAVIQMRTKLDVERYDAPCRLPSLDAVPACTPPCSPPHIVYRLSPSSTTAYSRHRRRISDPPGGRFNNKYNNISLYFVYHISLTVAVSSEMFYIASVHRKRFVYIISLNQPKSSLG